MGMKQNNNITGISPAPLNLKAGSLKIAAFLYVAPLHKSTSYRAESQTIT